VTLLVADLRVCQCRRDLAQQGFHQSRLIDHLCGRQLDGALVLVEQAWLGLAIQHAIWLYLRFTLSYRD
jgi:hypothetical protein